MRSLFVRSPWSVGGPILFIASLFGCLVIADAGLGQQSPAPAQDKKPAAASQENSPKDKSPGGGMKEMMQRMGQRGGGMEGMMQRMQKMGGQKPAAGQAEPTLEEMLNKALKDNPDIRVAEAKVREAEAESNRTRLQVTQKVLAFHHSRESQKAIIKVAEEDLQRIQKLEANKAVSQEEVKQAQQRLSVSKAKLAEIEAEMPYLLGQQQRFAVGSATISPEGKWLISNTDGTVKLWEAEIDPAKPSDINWRTPILENSNFIDSAAIELLGQFKQSPKETGSIADKVRKALDTQVTIDYKQKTVHDILEDLKKKVPGLSIHDLSGASQNIIDMQIDGPVPLRTALQLLEDSVTVRLEGGAVERVSFVLREYGLLFVPNGNLPPDAVHISNLSRGLKFTKSENDKAPAKDEKKPSAEEKKH
jgi:hypothetical protein